MASTWFVWEDNHAQQNRPADAGAAQMTALSFQDAVAAVIAENPIFETTEVDIRGVTYKAFANTPQTIRELLQHSRAAQGDGAADYLVFGDERWTYDEFCNDIKRLSAVLSERFGVGKGDRVGIAMRNCPELLLVFMATVSLGGIAVFLNAWWTTEELDYAVQDADVHLIFADAKRLERLRPLALDRKLQLIGVRDAEAIGDQGF
ncbi:MAG: AMP-binding protein, partial [Pseudodonghicola sp.]